MTWRQGVFSGVCGLTIGSAIASVSPTPTWQEAFMWIGIAGVGTVVLACMLEAGWDKPGRRK